MSKIAQLQNNILADAGFVNGVRPFITTDNIDLSNINEKIPDGSIDFSKNVVLLYYGKTDFGQDTVNGFIIGKDKADGATKFEIGSSAIKVLKYDGTDFTLTGGTITGGTIQTDTSGARVVISGNDMYCYDNTTGGSGITGDVASIYFPRTDDSSMRFAIQKRASFDNDSGNAMELFYDEEAPGGTYNYLFLGNEGYSANWYTDVTSVDGASGVTLSTEAQETGGFGGEEIQIFTDLYPDLAFSIETGASRVNLFANQSSTASVYNPVTGGGGGAISFGLHTSGGPALMAWIDSGGIWIGNETIKTYTTGASYLGDSSHRFGNVYSILGNFSGTVTAESISSTDFGPLMPGSSTFDIGSSSDKWDRVYAQTGYFDSSSIDDGLFNDTLKIPVGTNMY